MDVQPMSIETDARRHDLVQQHERVGSEHACSERRACTEQEQVRKQGAGAGYTAGKARMEYGDAGAPGACVTAHARHMQAARADTAGAAHKMDNAGCLPEEAANSAGTSRDFSHGCEEAGHAEFRNKSTCKSDAHGDGGTGERMRISFMAYRQVREGLVWVDEIYLHTRIRGIEGGGWRSGWYGG